MRRNSKNIEKWKTVDQDGVEVPFYVWKAGLPTDKQILSSPPFTIFPGQKRVKGTLPIMGTRKFGSRNIMIWRATDASINYDSYVAEVLWKAGLAEDPSSASRSIRNKIEMGDSASERDVEVGGRKVTLYDDSQVWPLAIEEGYTLIKVPNYLDFGQRVGSSLYILDKGTPKYDPHHYRQTPLLAEFLSEKPDVSELLEKINRYRRRIGQRELDPVASGWSEDDIISEAKRLPNRMKRRLMNG